MLRKLVPEGRRILETVVRQRSNPLEVARTYWHLYRYRRFSPDEIHFFGLLSPAADLGQVVSKEELLSVQRRLNVARLRPWTEDKLEFHARCGLSGLPTPAVRAVYGVDPDEAGDVEHLACVDDLRALLDGCPVDSLVVKPVDGVHGEGVARIDRTPAGWADHQGRPVRAEQLVERMDQSGYDRWMFQDRVRGHPDLCALSDTDALQTVRVVTYVDPRGQVQVLAARLRLVGGAHAHDNFDYGRTGNLIAILDIASGTIRSVVGGAGRPLTLHQVTQHPRTRRELIGYRVPRWEAVHDLARSAALAFRPLRTIGWDVAITPSDACLIEGNVTWDTLSGDPRMGEIYRYLAGECESLSTDDAGA